MNEIQPISVWTLTFGWREIQQWKRHRASYIQSDAFKDILLHCSSLYILYTLSGKIHLKQWRPWTWFSFCYRIVSSWCSHGSQCSEGNNGLQWAFTNFVGVAEELIYLSIVVSHQQISAIPLISAILHIILGITLVVWN